MIQTSNIKTRIAPSPTGLFHVGTARTALFNYLFAKQNGGQFLMRIEDTDLERSKKEFEEDILDGLKWLGLEFDGEIARQSDSKQRHLDAADQLLKEGKAYEKDGAIWFKVPPEEIVTFNDLVRGEVSFKTEDLKDFVIVRSDGSPIFYLVGVVDDFDMGITHVIRGEDLLSNTPKQILLARALGFPELIYAHLPLILNPDRSKLSKRHGATSVSEYRNKGYLPEAMINFLALLGWHEAGDQKSDIRNQKDEDIYNLNELIEKFDLARVSKSGAVFDLDKLNNINQHYINQKPQSELVKLLESYKGDLADDVFERSVEIIKNRLNYLEEFKELSRVFVEISDYPTELLIFKKSTRENTLIGLRATAEKLNVTDFSDLKSLEDALAQIVSEHNLTNGDVFWPVRVALSGQEKSPSPTEMLWVLGKEGSLERINKAISKL